MWLRNMKGHCTYQFLCNCGHSIFSKTSVYLFDKISLSVWFPKGCHANLKELIEIFFSISLTFYYSLLFPPPPPPPSCPVCLLPFLFPLLTSLPPSLLPSSFPPSFPSLPPTEFSSTMLVLSPQRFVSLQHSLLTPLQQWGKPL